MTKARCKFVVTKIEWSHKTFEEITLSAQYDEAMSKEDKAFSKSTPQGKLIFTLHNPSLNGTFKPGDEYYIDLIPVEQE